MCSISITPPCPRRSSNACASCSAISVGRAISALWKTAWTACTSAARRERASSSPRCSRKRPARPPATYPSPNREGGAFPSGTTDQLCIRPRLAVHSSVGGLNVRSKSYSRRSPAAHGGAHQGVRSHAFGGLGPARGFSQFDLRVSQSRGGGTRLRHHHREDSDGERRPRRPDLLAILA